MYRVSTADIALTIINPTILILKKTPDSPGDSLSPILTG